MNKKKIGVTALALLTLTTITTGCGKTAKLKTDNETVVALKNSKITANALYKELKKNSVEKLIDMIDHKLFDKKYPSDDTEKKSIDDQISQIKSYYGDNESNYLAAIKSYFGVESEDELKNKLSLEYKRGLAVNDYLEDNIKDDEINKYYEENVYGDIKASHILISVKTKDGMSDEEKEKAKKNAYKKAQDIIKKLDAGEKFEDLAKKYSDDSTNAKNGGNLGYFNKDDMDSNFWNAALKLEKNKYSSEPVESSYGYHIILKTGEKKKESLKSMKKEIKEKLAKEKLNNDNTLYYESLIEIRKENKISFGDSQLEKAYNDYMDNLIKKAKENSNSSSNE